MAVLRLLCYPAAGMSGTGTVPGDVDSCALVVPGRARVSREPRVAIGDCLGRYTVQARLGAGAMGEVFEAHDPEIDRRVALKVLKVGLRGASSEARARFQREAQAMARLNDPNVISVYDVGTIGERLFVTRELVHGPTLAAWIARGPHPWRQVVDVFAQAGRGLAAAHDAGIIHRDFKPSNVILGDRVRVADFGLARALGSGGVAAASSTLLGSKLTHTGQMLGTPAYMAPEQRAGGVVTAAADQYAFCVALDEALAGSGAPRFLAQLIARGKRRDPSQRYPSMRALLVELVREPARTRQRVALIAAAVALILAAVALVLAAVRMRDHWAPPACGASKAERLTRAWDWPGAVRHPDISAMHGAEGRLGA